MAEEYLVDSEQAEVEEVEEVEINMTFEDYMMRMISIILYEIQIIKGWLTDENDI